MSNTHQPVVRPKYIALDTGTWAKLLRQRTASETKDIIDVLNAGTLIPYVCFEHVLEHLQYDNRQVRNQRLDFFRQFRLIGFPRHFPSPPWRNSPLCGSYLDVQESEIATLLKDPALSLEQVVDHVRPDAIAGLSTGKQFAGDAVLQDIARSGRGTSVVMFDAQTAAKLKDRLAAALAQKFETEGDPQLTNVVQVAKDIIEISFQRLMPNCDISGTDPFRELVSRVLGVDLTRLPSKAKRKDFVIGRLATSPGPIAAVIGGASAFDAIL